MENKNSDIRRVTDKEERQQRLKYVLEKIEKEHGKGAIMKMDGDPVPVEVIPTGCMTLDLALGIGGVPRGRVVEIYGPESSGKTTVALSIIAEAQAMGGSAVFIDAEHALDPIYAEKIGVDIQNLYISQPDNGEQALEIADKLVQSGTIDILVIDSVAALIPRAELDGEMGQSSVGLQARLMSQALRKLTGSISKTQTCVIFINQLREKVGVMYGSPEVTTGGKALKFYASVRIDVRKAEAIKDGAEIIGNATKAKIVKNKMAPPFKVAEFDIMFGKGISKIGCILDVSIASGIVKKSGAWFAYNDEKIGNGRDKTIQFLNENPAMLKEIAQKTHEAILQKNDSATAKN